MKKLLQTFSTLLALFSALTGGLLFVRNQAPGGFALLPAKLFAGALSPISGLAGILGGLVGLLSGAPLAALFGGWGATAALGYLKKSAAQKTDFVAAFGPEKAGQLPGEAQLLAWRPAEEPRPRWQRDLVFATLENGRSLVCDLWQPAPGVTPSGMALIFLHGSAWTLLDKDFGTRTFFRHLAAQGHVVMDAAYRLFPETDMAGMVGDVKRALTWMKAHAGDYGVDPQKVVLMGASAGGHIALLAAYAPEHPAMTPAELVGQDLSVRAVVSFYGPVNLKACYYHTQQDKTALDLPQEAPQPDPAMDRKMRALMGAAYERLGFNKGPSAGSFYALLGGHPNQILETYDLFSPACYVHPGCPPTFLAQGEDDLITPAPATRAMARRLAEAGVPVVNLVFPHTDHGFDLALPALNPAARVAFAELDRFLTCLD